MTPLMTTTIKVTMYTICAVCAILAIRFIFADYAFEAVMYTILSFICWGQAKHAGDGTDD